LKGEDRSRMVYLDNAATTFPKPKEVYNEVLNCMQYYAANAGRASYDMALQASEKILETRENLRELFNIDNPLNIIFTSNATEALNIGIKGLLRPKDHVITTLIEHNSVLRPVKYMASKGVEITYIGTDEEGNIHLKDLRKEIRKNTRLVIVNHASNVLGNIQDIESIGEVTKRHGIYFMVDASQSAGLVEIDVKKCNIDLMAVSGHKALLGPQGTGILYIKDGIKLENYKDGGTGSESNSMDQPEYLPDKFESGTMNVPGIAGLCEGIKFIKTIGMTNLMSHEMSLLQYLYDELKRLDYIKIYGGGNFKSITPILSFNVDNMDSSMVGYILNKSAISVRSGFHCAPLIHGIIGTHKRGTIRVSPGYFNTMEDMNLLVKVLQEIKNA
jgi:cysteine desulfurase family protein